MDVLHSRKPYLEMERQNYNGLVRHRAFDAWAAFGGTKSRLRAAVENIDDAASGSLSDKPLDLTIKPLKLRIAPFLHLQPDKA
ncbi:hypothetical protein [Eikenella corrodens]|uniref:Uncharacterized protein n=1 Tax=Eikenella corrodens TaxID=539 RepID=A0A3S9SKN9_EIKCO|nr:hypothetical protein [Eikenella corrodens]AZR60083.1 hypothetical protein ELB75_08630 [Eikenella corrodens]